MAVEPGAPAAGAIDECVHCKYGDTGFRILFFVFMVVRVDDLQAVVQELVVRGVERLAAAVAPEVAEVVDQCRRLKDGESPRHELTRRTARPFRADAVVFAAERGVVEALDELDAVESIQHRRFQQLVYFLFVTHVFQLFNFSTALRASPEGEPRIAGATRW